MPATGEVSSSLDDRIARLERTWRRRWLVSAPILVVVAATAGWAAASARVHATWGDLRARSLTIVGGHDEPVARVWGMPKGGRLDLFQPGLGTQVVLGAFGGDDAGFGLVRSEGGRILMSLAAGVDGTSRGLSIEGKGRSRLVAGIVGEREDEPVLAFFDENPATRVELTPGALRLRDEKGAMVFSAPDPKATGSSR